MALGFTEASSNGGDFLPIIKFDARAGRFFRVDRTAGNDGWESHSEDITQNFSAVVDLHNIEAGWAAFIDGRPSFAMAPVGERFPEKPSDSHKQGFRCKVKLGKDAAGGQPAIREFASTAQGVRKAIDALHDQFLKEVGDNAGKLPVVTCEQTIAIETQTPAGKTINYAPAFKIKSWVKRPADLPERAESSPASRPPRTGSAPAVPPAAAAPADDEDDFG